MKAWTLTDKRRLELCTVEDPVELTQMAKVKVIRASIAASDLALYDGLYGNYPIVPSRIAVGLISQCDDITLQKGARVMLAPYTRSCDRLRINAVHTDGYLSDYAVVPLHRVYSMPEGIGDDMIPFIEDIALAIKAYEKLDVSRTQYVLIYGCSTLSLILAQLCIYYQAIPIVVDQDEKRLEIAGELGIYYQINPSEENPAEKLKEITAGKMAEYLVVDTDSFHVADEMTELITCGGKVCLMGVNTRQSKMRGDFSPIINQDLTIYGVSDGAGELETAINMLATEIVRVDLLLDRVVDFEQVPDTMMEMSGRQNPFKTIVKC